MLIIDVNEFNIKSIFRKMRLIIKYCDKKGCYVKFNSTGLNDLLLRDINNIEIAINKKVLKERYDFIYDVVCDYLDEEIEKKDYCKFVNDICIKYREKNSSHKNGCCENKCRGRCPYLIESKCLLNCISCKFFVCPILRKMGIRHNINDFVLIKFFFNRKQKYILQFSYFTPKNVIIERLLKNEYIPFGSFKNINIKNH